MLFSLGTYSYFNISLGSIVIVSHALIGTKESTFKSPRIQVSFFSPPWGQKGWQIKNQNWRCHFKEFEWTLMESWRQRGLTAEKCHTVAWHTYNTFEERKNKKHYISILNCTNKNKYIKHHWSFIHGSWSYNS